VFALKEDMLRIVQVSLLGSVLSNLLLVLGTSFIIGGVMKKEQTFNTTMTSTNSGLLMLGVIGLMYPAVLSLAGANANGIVSELGLSRFTALILMGLYVAYLVFQLKTHAHLFADDEDDDDDGGKDLTILEGLIWLAVVTILISMLSDFLVDSIRGTAVAWGIPEIFIGVILVPIVGNAAEHWTALSAAYKSKMDLALGVAVGSSTQICILVVPFAVLLGWMMGKPLSLYFQAFETISIFTAALLTQFVTAEGKVTWLSGLKLILCYLLLAGGFAVHTDTMQDAL
jgi:Ca2+:H+ antiporter